LKHGRSTLWALAITAGLASAAAASGGSKEEPRSGRSSDPAGPSVVLASLGPGFERSPLFGSDLLRNFRSLVQSIDLSGHRRKQSTGFTFSRGTAASSSTALRLGRVSYGRQTSPEPPIDDDSKYRWLLRSQKRNVLRDEGSGPAELTETAVASRPRQRRHMGDVQGEVTLSSSRDGGGLMGDSASASRGATEVRVAFPVLGRSQTTLQGRLSGDTGNLTWAARANISYSEIEKHMMDAGVVLGSLLFQNSLQSPRPGGESFRADWVAGAYARDEWAFHPRHAVSYGLTYQRFGFGTTAGFFCPQMAFMTKVSEGFRIANEIAYGVSLPGRAMQWSGPRVTESYTLSDSSDLSPERFLAFRARVEKQIGSRHFLDLAYVHERVESPILQVPYRDFVPGGHDNYSYRYMLANSDDLNSHAVRVGYRTRIGENIVGGVSYKVNRSKAFVPSTTPTSFVSDVPLDLQPWAGDRYVQTVCMTLTYTVPSTQSSISGDYRWDSALLLRPDLVVDSLDDPTTQIALSVRQGIPFISVDGTLWELIVDVRNPFTIGDSDLLSFGAEERIVLLVPHPRRITGGLSFKF